MTIQITPEQMMTYQKTARRRQVEEQRRLTLRYERAWTLARQAAALLRGQFEVERVAVFGSLVHREFFHTRSDVDLAVWGLDQRQYYRAVAQVQDLDTSFEVDLVRVEEAAALLQSGIVAEGVAL